MLLKQSLQPQVDVLLLPGLSNFEGAAYAPPKRRSETGNELPACPPTPKLPDEESHDPAPEPAAAPPPVDEPKAAVSAEPEDAVSTEPKGNSTAAECRSFGDWF